MFRGWSSSEAPLLVVEPLNLSVKADSDPHKRIKAIRVYAKETLSILPSSQRPASGGKWDNLIEPNKLRSATVVFHPEEAERLGLEIDHDDSHARNPDGGDFALLIHGMGAKGSEHNAAIKRLKAEKIEYAYSKKKKTKAKAEK